MRLNNIYFSKHQNKQCFSSRHVKKFDFNQETSGKRDKGKKRENEGGQDSESASEIQKERERKKERECVCRSTYHHHSCLCPSHYLRHRRHGHNILHLNLPY